MKMEITMATIGRLIKNSLIIMLLPGVKCLLYLIAAGRVVIPVDGNRFDSILGINTCIANNGYPFTLHSHRR
jgi:hypothetical protein